MELTTVRCKNCGAMLDPRIAIGGVVECPYCGTPWIMPKTETVPEAKKYIHDGNAALDVCDFDHAFTYFQKASELDAGEPEAFFGMALATFRVQYLKDSVNDRLQPICHLFTQNTFTKNSYFRQALDLATPKQREVYRSRGSEIDDVCEEFLALKEQGIKYDCFLCVKVTDDDSGTQTADSIAANKLYDFLKDKGYRPFFSERILANKAGSAYEAHILYALYVSECMLIVCSDEKFLRTKWVKNEYTRFMGMMSDGGKERDAVTFVFNGTPIERLPNGKKIQGIDLATPKAYSLIEGYVESHTPEARRSREREAEEKRRQQEEVDTLLQEMRDLQQKREEDNRRQAIQMQSAGTGGPAPTIESMLERARQELESCDYDGAAKFYQGVLDIDPKNFEAWRGMFLTEFQVMREEKLGGRMSLETVRKILSSKNFRYAREYATTDKAQNRIKTVMDRINTYLEREKRHLESEQARLADLRKNSEAQKTALEQKTLEAEWLKKTKQKFEDKRMRILTAGGILGIAAGIATIILLCIYIPQWNPIIPAGGAFWIGLIPGVVVAGLFTGLFALFVPRKINGMNEKELNERLEGANAEVEALNRDIATLQKAIASLEKQLPAEREKLKEVCSLFS